ncbi:MAG: hypothetical protein II440_07785, partial [Clostridia bacterium]|nr:hypothetical protein [Clostridia bacterium]
PIELRELNFWKNFKRTPQNFTVEVIKDETGADYDYVITRKTNAPTAAVATTSTKTNMPPVAPSSAGEAPKRKRPNSGRTAKCTICTKEYKESDLFLFDNRNFCSDCLNTLIKEKLDTTPVDPIKKVIDDVVAADVLYCTYSTVTNYPYLDDEFCVNVCTMKRTAEIAVDDTAATAVDDKGEFFDDLKRFGLKKIIVNGDKEHIYAPEDFDEHVKSEGVIAPKLYFKILNFMQRKDDELRETIAASFLGNKVYTYALDDDITEITRENLDEFKPLLITDGYAKFCPVFTDFSEARSVGMPFKGLYVIDARLIAEYTDATHFIINPSTLGFIMNKTILNGIKANYDQDLVDGLNVEKTDEPFVIKDKPTVKVTAPVVEEAKETVSPVQEPAAEAASVEEAAAKPADEPLSQPVAATTSFEFNVPSKPADEPISQPASTAPAFDFAAPSAQPVGGVPTYEFDAQPKQSDTAASFEFGVPNTPPAKPAPKPQKTSSFLKFDSLSKSAFEKKPSFAFPSFRKPTDNKPAPTPKTQPAPYTPATKPAPYTPSQPQFTPAPEFTPAP